MRPEEVFDSFYRSTRDALLHQAFLLTGDVQAAGGAVREAYVAAWQHWSRASRYEDPLDYVRPLAWRYAQRRHRGRIWHRNRGISEADRSALDALHKLPTIQRRLLVLTDVARLDLPAAAREVSLTVEAAGLRLQMARDSVATALAVRPGLIGQRLEAVGYASTVAGTLPRTSIVMRAGQKRRRAQSAVLVAGVLALTIGAGAVANQPGRHRPGSAAVFLPSASPSSTGTTPPVEAVGDYQLINPDTLSRLVVGTTWTEQRTDSNTDGDGLNSPCQTKRFADPHGVSALVRVFKTSGKVSMRAVETVETSRTPRRSRLAFNVMTEWFGGCHASRTQLRSAYATQGVGDQGFLIYLVSRGKTNRAISVAIARSGSKTVSLAVTTPAPKAPGTHRMLVAVGTALAKICGEDPCVEDATTATPRLPRVDSKFGLLAAVDLPPVGRVTQLWVGTRPAAGKEPPATGACKTPRFRKAVPDATRSRTFLIPQASLPTSFGLAETVGRFGQQADAADFMKRLSNSLRSCAKKGFTEDLVKTGRKKNATLSYETWFLRTRLSRRAYLNVRIAVVRNGVRVALVAFTPTDKVDMSRQQFNALALRAAQRLGS